MSNASVVIKNLSVSLGGKDVLRDISFSLPAGKVIGLLGPSGAGKTTLMRTIVGRQGIDSGSISVLGYQAGEPSLRTKVGYMTQSASIYSDLTVLENLRYFAKLVNVPKQRATEIIKTVHLAPQTKQLVSTLSGGQRSRVSLAVSLLNNPRLLVLDEPTVGIDPLLRRDLWKQFHELADTGITLLISSHVMDEASQCEELLLMRDGSLLAQGSLPKLFEQTKQHDVESVFLKLVEAK